MVKRAFTFGIGHAEWSRHFVVIESETGEHCRAEMFNRFGRDWAFEYDPDSEKLLAMNYRQIPLDAPVLTNPPTYPGGHFYVDSRTGEVRSVDV